MREELIVKERGTGIVLARGIRDENVHIVEGCWYFDQRDVNMERLTITERTYNCPYKGICNWIELVDNEAHNNIGFVYVNTNADYEFIRDRVGFYGRDTSLTEVETRQQTEQH